MRRLLLFLSVLALFALVACQQEQERQCSCGSPHYVPGSPGGTSTSPEQSKLEGKAMVDGEGQPGVSDIDPSVLVIYARSPCAFDGGADDAGDPATDAGEDASDADDAGDASDAADAADAGDADAGDGGANWTERVVVHLGALPRGGPDASVDLAEAGAYATAIDPTTCVAIRIPLFGKAVGIGPESYESGWHVSARTPRTYARAVVIEAHIFHKSSSSYDYAPSSPSTECY